MSFYILQIVASLSRTSNTPDSWPWVSASIVTDLTLCVLELGAQAREASLRTASECYKASHFASENSKQ